MNKLTKLACTLVLSIFAFSAVANDLSYSITAKKSVVSIHFSNLLGTDKAVKVQVVDDEGNEFLEQDFTINSSKTENVDLEVLEKGVYTFKMTFEDKVVRREFRLSKSKRVSLRDYSMQSINRGIVVRMQGNIMKVETTSQLKEDVNLLFKSYTGGEELLYKVSFFSGENAITNIDLRPLGVSQFILNVVENNVTYTDEITMF
ncbi:DUF3244 domain-containing protein [Flammeovirga aprica]|uniref:DUF3244 domain-containing protein n=1 Tax=Flammeovirga aprica JL-4 TaxID=694437 RepID=A0A7X9P2C6_9BACT|nr:DUF3244 domain-containing protein [Flammeovirga aprica]NME68261.1 DUF3244 domain-containing protein [Flammeovirga aprica JL-4]